MKTNPLFATVQRAAALLLLAAVNSQLSTACAQGSLTPPGAPGPTFKTLHQVEPRTPISSLPFNITNPGSFYVTSNLTFAGSGVCIQLNANDVSIDLNGFTLFGNSNASAIGQSGSGKASGIAVRNGRLIGWGSGLNLAIFNSPTNTRLENVVLTGTAAAFGYGISAGHETLVSHCVISGFSGSGSFGILAADRNIIQSTLVSDCESGIDLGSYSTVEGCVVRNCIGGTGLQTGDSSLVRNNVVDGCREAIRVFRSCLVSGNLCLNSVSNRAGIYLAGSLNRVEDNVANNNARGFQSLAGTTNNFVIRNFASGNTIANYDFLGTVIGGPIVTNLGTITTNNPWANFSN